MKKFVGKGVCSAAACGKIKIFTGGEIHADKVSVTDTENQKKETFPCQKRGCFPTRRDI